MARSRRLEGLGVTLLVGLIYLLVGRGFAVPREHVQAWRLAAWGVSALAFAAHLAYEHLKLRDSPRAAALHAALAVALGAFGLALAGMMRSLATGAGMRPAWLLALVLWPAITAIPAFLVAFTMGLVVARLRASPHSQGPDTV